MTAALVLFFEASEVPWLRSLGMPSVDKTSGKGHTKGKTPEIPKAAPAWYRPVLLAYCLFQVLFPLRGFFLPNAMDYTTIGNRFAWRMKIDTRQVERINFTLEDPKTGQTTPVNPTGLLNDMQIRLLASDPRAVRTFAEALRKEAVRRGANADIKVKVTIKEGYNGGPVQDFIVPGVDVSRVVYSPMVRLDWVVPPLR